MITNRISTNSVGHSLSVPKYAHITTTLRNAHIKKKGIRKILVPLDGSLFAEHAVPIALAIAEECDAVLQLVHVLVPGEVLEPFEMLHFPEAALENKKNRKQAYLSKLAHRVTTNTAVGVSSTVIQGIDASKALQETYGNTSDLVVMATHGRGMLGRFWWGSVAHSLLQKANVPLILVSGHDTKPDLVPQETDNLLLPIDGDKQSERVVDSLLRLGLFANARHTLLHRKRPELVIKKRGERFRTEWAPTSTREADAMNVLRPVERVLVEDSRQVEKKVICSEKPTWKVVSDYANLLERSLVACTYHRSTPIERIVRPGMSEELLRAVKCPLMLVPD